MKSLLKKLVLGVFVLMNVWVVKANPVDPPDAPSPDVYAGAKAILASVKEEWEQNGGYIKWNLQNYNEIKEYTFTADIPTFLSNTLWSQYKNCFYDRLCVIYNYCDGQDRRVLDLYPVASIQWGFEDENENAMVATFRDIIVRGTNYNRTFLERLFKPDHFTGGVLLLLTDEMKNYIAEREPNWKPSSVFQTHKDFTYTETK